MPAHKFTKKDLKQDSFVTTTEKVLEFGQRNATVIGAVFLVIVVALVGGSYWKSSRTAAAQEASAMLYQGQVFATQGEYAAAMSTLQECIDKHGGSEFGYYARVSLVQAMLSMGDVTGALAQAQQFAGDIPSNHPAASELGILETYAMADAGQPGAAADAMATYIQDDLADAVFYDRSVQQADWLEAAGRHAEAVAVLERLDDQVKRGELKGISSGDLEKRLAVSKALHH